MSAQRYPARVGSRGVAYGILRGGRTRGAAQQEPAGSVMAAVLVATDQLRALQRQASGLGSDILRFQLELLQDDGLALDLLAVAEGEGAPETAVAQVFDRQIGVYAASGNPRFASRAADLADLRDRLLSALEGKVAARPEWPEQTILLAEDLTPSAFLELDRSKVVGIVDRRGSVASHAALLARAEGVPMLVGVGPLAHDSDGRPALLDAEDGVLVIDPPEGLSRRAQTAAPVAGEAGEGSEEETGETVDDEGLVARPGSAPVELYLTVNSLDALTAARPGQFAGIGLVRSELLIGDAAVLADADRQAELYRPLFAWAGERPVTVRLLDAGGDKHVAGFSPAGGGFLGARGARLLMREPEVLRTQLVAILRAAAGRPVRILVPLLTLPDEMAFFRDELGGALASEAEDGARVLLGMMVETPAAALQVDGFEADFYALGTNDLVQYTLALSRDGEGLPGLFGIPDAVIELVRRVVDHAARGNRPVSLCGDVAASPEELGRLLECGVRAFSVPPRLAPRFRQFARSGQ